MISRGNTASTERLRTGTRTERRWPTSSSSYARVDVERARPIADALQAQGWEVWWDLASLRTEQSFNKAIRKALGRAKCVLVLWSETSIESRWVEAEASWVWERDKLASVLLDEDLRPPFP